MKPGYSKKNTDALTRTEVVLIIVLVGFLAFLLLPAWSVAKRQARMIKCVSNLKCVGLSFRLWSGDNGDYFPMQVSITNGGTMELAEKAEAFVHFQALSNELEPKYLACPSDRNKSLASSWNPNFGNQNLSYFVDLDARDYSETNILAGDRNITLDGTQAPSGLLKLRSDSTIDWSGKTHGRFGNVAFADGSVRDYLDGEKLRGVLQKTGVATNRLVIP